MHESAEFLALFRDADTIGPLRYTLQPPGTDIGSAARLFQLRLRRPVSWVQCNQSTLALSARNNLDGDVADRAGAKTRTIVPRHCCRGWPFASLSEVSATSSSLSPTGAFILDVGHSLCVWCGNRAGERRAREVLEIAHRIRFRERAGGVRVLLVYRHTIWGSVAHCGTSEREETTGDQIDGADGDTADAVTRKSRSDCADTGVEFHDDQCGDAFFWKALGVRIENREIKSHLEHKMAAWKEARRSALARQAARKLKRGDRERELSLRRLARARAAVSRSIEGDGDSGDDCRKPADSNGASDNDFDSCDDVAWTASGGGGCFVADTNDSASSSCDDVNAKDAFHLSTGSFSDVDDGEAAEERAQACERVDTEAASESSGDDGNADSLSSGNETDTQLAPDTATANVSGLPTIHQRRHLLRCWRRRRRRRRLLSAQIPPIIFAVLKTGGADAERRNCGPFATSEVSYESHSPPRALLQQHKSGMLIIDSGSLCKSRAGSRASEIAITRARPLFGWVGAHAPDEVRAVALAILQRFVDVGHTVIPVPGAAIASTGRAAPPVPAAALRRRDTPLVVVHDGAETPAFRDLFEDWSATPTALEVQASVLERKFGGIDPDAKVGADYYDSESAHDLRHRDKVVLDLCSARFLRDTQIIGVQEPYVVAEPWPSRVCVTRTRVAPQGGVEPSWSRTCVVASQMHGTGDSTSSSDSDSDSDGSQTDRGAGDISDQGVDSLRPNHVTSPRLILQLLPTDYAVRLRVFNGAGIFGAMRLSASVGSAPAADTAEADVEAGGGMLSDTLIGSAIVVVRLPPLSAGLVSKVKSGVASNVAVTLSGAWQSESGAPNLPIDPFDIRAIDQVGAVSDAAVAGGESEGVENNDTR
eukprot:g2305.t1